MLIPSTTLTAARVTYMDGNAGIFQTARLMRAIVANYKVNLEIRALALSLVEFLPGKDEMGEIECLFTFVRDKIRYVKDIAGVETISTPEITLQIGQGDCDDQSVLLACLLEAIGYQTGFKLTAYTGDTFQHVYVVVLSPRGWMCLDPTEDGEMGYEVLGAISEAYVF